MLLHLIPATKNDEKGANFFTLPINANGDSWVFVVAVVDDPNSCDWLAISANY
jgi:hypothetical protein